jgi:hypothetical protein
MEGRDPVKSRHRQPTATTAIFSGAGGSRIPRAAPRSAAARFFDRSDTARERRFIAELNTKNFLRRAALALVMFSANPALGDGTALDRYVGSMTPCSGRRCATPIAALLSRAGPTRCALCTRIRGSTPSGNISGTPLAAMPAQVRATLGFTPRDDLPDAFVGGVDVRHVETAKAPLLRKLLNQMLRTPVCRHTLHP